MTASSAPASDRVEAARYALLRRLAPAMRHSLVVNLQPIGMVYEVMERRLRTPEPDLAGVQGSARKIHGFARAALDACLDVVTWLAPEPEAAIGAAEGVRECTGLLATSLSFRGFTLRDETGLVPGQVRLSAMRSVLTAALVQCTDELSAPAELRISAAASAAGLELDLRLRPTAGEAGVPTPANYRLLTWSDVQALAAAEGAALARAEPGHVRILLPWMAAPPP